MLRRGWAGLQQSLHVQPYVHVYHGLMCMYISEVYKLWTLWKCSKYVAVCVFCCKHSGTFYVNYTNEDSHIIQKKNNKGNIEDLQDVSLLQFMFY